MELEMGQLGQDNTDVSASYFRILSNIYEEYQKSHTIIISDIEKVQNSLFKQFKICSIYFNSLAPVVG